ncbi:MAG: transcriptional regulator [Ectothiorhodospiraceae bacterium]|nr:transcriptional regulator [Ectothiorhodospiraceae bacterium]
MKFSSQEEYGLRCLLNLARHYAPGESRTIQQISNDEGLSVSYVGKLMRILRLGGFLESVRGTEGGYSLSRPPGDIQISDVLDTLGGKLFEPDFCDRHSGVEEICTHDSACAIRPLWSHIQSAIDSALLDVTLVDLMDNHPHKQRPVPLSPQKIPSQPATVMSVK